MKTVVKVINDQVLVRRIEPQAVSAGGILIPVSAQQQQQEGTVIAVGPGKFVEFGKGQLAPDPNIKEMQEILYGDVPLLAPITVKPGDRIMFSKYAGADIELQGEKYTILTEAAIHCILEQVEDVDDAKYEHTFAALGEVYAEADAKRMGEYAAKQTARFGP